ncbi:hypothetical protein ACFLU1_05005 [Chloroflexota bacterium]
MNVRKWLILALAMVTVMSLTTLTGVTEGLFVDDEQSTDDALGIRWGLFTLNDGFENTGSPAWDDNWDENGTTDWHQTTAYPHSGTYSAESDPTYKGYLTSDEIEASTADNITVTFWFRPKSLETGDVLVQIYDGTTYNTWYDLTTYPTYSGGSYCLFSEVITDSQYLIAGFRLRFDTSALGTGEDLKIDDFVIATDTVPPAVPTGLVATGGNEEINLDWNSNNETDLWGYNVYRGPNSGNYTQVNVMPVLVSDYTDTIYGGGTFYYVVTAVDYGNNESGYSNEDSETAIDVAPAAAANLTAVAGNEEIVLDWNDNIETDIEGYNVYRGLSSGNITELISSNVSSSNYTDTGLYGGGLYYYEVTAVDQGANESARSNTANATAIDVAPAAPANLAATPGNEEIVLNWDDNTETDFEGYNVYRGPSSGNITELISSNVSGSAYTDSLLYGGGLYFYEVTAVDLGANDSARSNTANATAIDVAPAAPANLGATPGNEQIVLDWDDNIETDLDGYNVYRGPSSGSITNLIASDISISNYTDTGLYGGGLYYYEVTAVDLGVNESTRSNTTNATAVDVAPAAPANLVATAGPDDLEISLNWDDNTETDLEGYNVYHGLSSGNITELVSSNLSSSNFTDTGLTFGVHYYEVTAVDLGINESGRSNTDSAVAVTTMITVLNDGFENTGSPAWDDLWDENGTTTWTQDSSKPHSGTYNANSNAATAGYLTSDDMEASVADNITVSFWFNTKSLEADDIWVQTYNGTDYVNWHDLTAYPTYVNNVWTLFSEVITDSQYLISGFRLRFDSTAMSSIEEANIDDIVITTDTIPPAAPTGLAATAGNEEISLDWTSNNETDLWGYNVYRGPNSGNTTNQLNVTPVLVSDYTDTGLYGGGTFYYVVTAVDLGNNESGISNEDSATAVDVAPAASTNLTATPGNEQIVLNWADNVETDIDGYNVYRGPSSGNITNLISSNVSSSNYTDTGLYGGGLYYYEVTAVDLGANESARSNTANATALDSAPVAPTGLAATPGNEEILLNWDDNSEPDFDNYNVYRGPTSGNITTLVASNVSTSTYNDTLLYGGGLYFYEVTAVDLGAYESARSNTANATAVDITPSAPTGLAATPGNEEIVLNWDDNIETDIDGYNVYRGPSSGNITNLIASDVSESNYTDTGLYGGGLYYYEVTAVDLGANESNRSNNTNATAVDIAPAAPANLAATAGPGDLEISLNWDDNTETDLEGYNVYRGPSSGNITELISSNVSSSAYSDSGLTYGVTYYYEVTAVDLGLNESGRSNTDSATADDVAPAAPTGLTATAGFKQVILDWNDNSEPDFEGYNVYRGLSSGNITELITSNVSVSTYTDTGLNNGTTYYYEVTAVDSGSNESTRSNTDSAKPTGTPATLLDDDFEGTPWDDNWDDNGTTDWQTGIGYNSTNSAETYTGDTYLTSDDLDASLSDNITVSFWFNIKLLNKGSLYIQTYNGTAYNNWFDLTTYPGVVKNTWIQFSQTITAEEYFKSNFRIRFDSSGLSTYAYIDDVLIVTNQ